MKSLKAVLVIGLFFLAQSFILAQDLETEAVEDNSLETQFNDLKNKSNSYQEYKVVKVVSLNNFWQNVEDSLAAFHQEIEEANSAIARQNQKLDSLNQKLEAREEALEKSEYDIAHLTVLGMDVEKDSYVTFTWIVFFVLLLILGITFAKFKNSNKVAVEKKSDYDELSQELNDYKQKAREKEIKLMRELQTERNTIEELNQKIATLRKQAH